MRNKKVLPFETVGQKQATETTTEIPDSMTLKEFRARLKKDYPQWLRGGGGIHMVLRVLGEVTGCKEEYMRIKLVREALKEEDPFDDSTREKVMQMHIRNETYNRFLEIIERYKLAVRKN